MNYQQKYIKENDPIFVNYLNNHSKYRSENGGVSSRLANDIFSKANSIKVTKIESLSTKRLSFIVSSFGSDKVEIYPKWLQYVSAEMALDLGIDIEDRVIFSLAKLHASSYQKDKVDSFSLVGFSIFLFAKINKKIENIHLPIIRKALEQLNYKKVI